ncbi:MAG TPA: hypothetical protein DCE42_02120, partial [Myxococcales bacterium]|nr:hypothetical protein [Myxococcales bacterium]
NFSLPPWASDAFKKTLTPKPASPKSLAKEAFAETYIAPNNDNPPLVAAPSNPPPADEPDDELELLLSGAEDLIDARDYSGAMELLELCLDSSPHHGKAKSLVQKCEQQLASQYQEQFQDLDMIPKMDCHPDQLTQHRLDHQAGFVISQLDGHTSIQDLLLITGLEEFTLLRILSQLVDKNLVSLS